MQSTIHVQIYSQIPDQFGIQLQEAGYYQPVPETGKTLHVIWAKSPQCRGHTLLNIIPRKLLCTNLLQTWMLPAESQMGTWWTCHGNVWIPSGTGNNFLHQQIFSSEFPPMLRNQPRCENWDTLRLLSSTSHGHFKIQSPFFIKTWC